MRSIKQQKMKLEKDKYFIQIKDIVLKYFDKNVKIILFGSRARRTNADNSDYDIALISNDPKICIKISLIKEKIGNSNIPNKVDILDYNNVFDKIKENILKDGIRWEI